MYTTAVISIPCKEINANYQHKQELFFQANGHKTTLLISRGLPNANMAIN